MFATAVRLLARRAGLRPVKLANLGDQAQSASQTLFKILEQHGPLTVSDCWKHTSQVMFLQQLLFKLSIHLSILVPVPCVRHLTTSLEHHSGIPPPEGSENFTKDTWSVP